VAGFDEPTIDVPAIHEPTIDELATAAELFPDFEPEAGGEPFSDADADASAEANAGLEPPSEHEPLPTIAIPAGNGPVTALTFEADIRL